MRPLLLAFLVVCSAAVAFMAHGADSVAYGYDELGRLKTLTYANGTTITYSYDLAGNRLAQQVVCGSSGC